MSWYKYEKEAGPDREGKIRWRIVGTLLFILAILAVGAYSAKETDMNIENSSIMENIFGEDE